jgi:hypothetical protein
VIAVASVDQCRNSSAAVLAGKASVFGCSADGAAPQRVEGLLQLGGAGFRSLSLPLAGGRRLDWGVTRFTAAVDRRLLPAPTSPECVYSSGSGPRPGLRVCPGHCHAGLPRAAGWCPSSLTAVGVVPRQAPTAACFVITLPPRSSGYAPSPVGGTEGSQCAAVAGDRQLTPHVLLLTIIAHDAP